MQLLTKERQATAYVKKKSLHGQRVVVVVYAGNFLGGK